MSESLIASTSPHPSPRLPSDGLIVPLFQGESLSETAAAIDESLGGLLEQMRERREFRSELYEVAVLPTLGRIPALRLVLVGLGKVDSCTATTCRLALAAASRAAGRRGIYTLAVQATDLPLSPAEASVVIAEGAELSRFAVDTYRTGERRDTQVREITVCGGTEDGVREGLIRGRAKNWARELINEPSNILDPVELARRAAEMAVEVGLGYRELDEAALEAESMGAYLAVTRGAEAPPRFIVLEHRKGGDAPLLALVGKAVCFDTGGISIKPTLDMGKMKGDMGGGAAVLGAMRAIAELDIPANVIGLVPAVVNMPDGRAWKPGDVITAKSGKTIETLTTDAEGRMLLADGLAYAQQLGADYLVDIATLTGAVGIALGHIASGLFGTHDSLVDALREDGEAAGERHWPMPLFPEYKELIKSEIADLKNSGGRLAGAITAAAFLKEFAGEKPWAHLDIAASTTNEKSRPYAPAGPTGTGVGTFINLARRLAEQGRL